MLSKYNATDIEIALNEENPAPPFPPASDRAAWEAVRERLGADGVQGYITKAEEMLNTPIPSLPATLYLEFKRVGQREGYQEPMRVRRSMLAALTMAECLEYQGRFLDKLMDVVWAMCEESSWSLPAHQTELTDIHAPVIDLAASQTGHMLAEFDALLGDELDPLVRKRIHDEIDRRLLVPYLGSHRWWWLYNTQIRRVNNWSAVCNGNIVSAAIYVEKDNARLAEIIARAARSLDDYLETFDSQGGSSEGPGYWSYGYGNYVVVAHMVEHRTNGRVNFFEGDLIRDVSQFPARTILSGNTFVNFSDCDADITITPSLLAYLSRRLDLPDLMVLARQQPVEGSRAERELTWATRDLFWYVEPGDPQTFTPNERDWYQDMMWMISRYDPADPDALVLAAKGGHNGEMHNQNDVGSIIVHMNGESVIADVGRGRYTKAYFGPERYEHFVNRSLGHSCPVPNGQEQYPSEQYHAVLLDHQDDLMVLDLQGAYPPEAELASLKRTVALHRDAPQGWVELSDEVQFASKAGSLQSVLTTFAPVEVQEDRVILKGERATLEVKYDAEQIVAKVEVERDVDFSFGYQDVNCVVFELKYPAQAAKIALKIVPVS